MWWWYLTAAAACLAGPTPGLRLPTTTTTDLPSTTTEALADLLNGALGPDVGGETAGDVSSLKQGAGDSLFLKQGGAGDVSSLKQGGAGDGSGCVCVPYYLCPNGSVLTDGTGLLDIKAKPGACADFMDVCCEAPNDPEKPIVPVGPKRQGCGHRNPEGVGFRITGATGGEAQFGEFPWMVAILKTSTDGQNLLLYQCGGALIHPSVVLTAAHCIKARQPKELMVRAGEWDTQRDNEVYPHSDVRVLESAVHPGFSSGSLWNDVGLLFLEEPFQLRENVDTVCLPPAGPVPLSKECFASGWGKNTFGDEGKSQVILKKVELPIVENRRCESLLRQTRLGKYFKLDESFVCAGGEPGKDTCKGDGGSPLVCPVPSRPGAYEVTGLVSWGIGCGGETPGVYAGVGFARPWIDGVLARYKVQLD